MSLPHSAALAMWFGALRTGEADPTKVVRRTCGEAPHSIVVDHDSHQSLEQAVRGWAVSGQRMSLALPVPGDPVGLAGPAAFNQAALEAGEAVVLSNGSGDGSGLVPRLDARTLVWDVRPAVAPPYVDTGEVARDLRACLLATTRQLVELDVASWQPEIPDLLMNVRHRPTPATPRHWDARRVETLDRALLCLEVVALALTDEGGAVTAYEMERRRGALRDLDRAARRALAGTCSDSLLTP